MKLSHPALSAPIEFKENQINILVIENKELLLNMIKELVDSQDGAETDNFVLSEENTILNMTVVDTITDIFKIDLNSKKVINKLLSIVSQIANEEQYFAETASITGEIYALCDKLTGELEYSVVCDEPSVADIIKACNIHFDLDENDLCDTLSEYFSVMSELAKIKLFIIVNLHQFIPASTIEELYKDIQYKKHNILLIETQEPEERLSCERYRIIDDDLCDIT